MAQILPIRFQEHLQVGAEGPGEAGLGRGERALGRAGRSLRQRSRPGMVPGREASGLSVVSPWGSCGDPGPSGGGVAAFPQALLASRSGSAFPPRAARRAAPKGTF